MKQEKKQALSLFHREQILAAAEMLFEQNGVSGTTVDSIAKAASYSKATIYVYFKNKEEIINAIILKGMRLLHDKLASAVADGTGWIDTYFLICKEIALFYDENPMAYDAAAGKINVSLTSAETPQVFRDVFETGEKVNRLIAAFLEKGADLGLIKRQENVLGTVFVLWAAISGVIKMAVQKEMYLSEYLHFTKDAFLFRGYQTLLDSILIERDK